MVLLRQISLNQKESTNMMEPQNDSILLEVDWSKIKLLEEADDKMIPDEGNRQVLIASFKKQVDETRAKIVSDIAK